MSIMSKSEVVMKLLFMMFFGVTLVLSYSLTPYTIEGKILQVAVSKLEENKLHQKALASGVAKIYYTTGELHLEYIKNKKNKLTVKEYYKSGTIHLLCHYIDEMKHGVAEVYYENGKLAGKLNYTHNQMNGRYDEYRKDGKLHFQKSFTNDILEIPIIKYDIEGNKKYLLDDENSKEVCY